MSELVQFKQFRLKIDIKQTALWEPPECAVKVPSNFNAMIAIAY